MHQEQPVSLSFTENMKGFIDLDIADAEDVEVKPDSDQHPCMFHLTITIPDVDFMLIDPREQGTAVGYIDCEALGGKCEIIDGVFRLFVDAGVPHKNIRHMCYQLTFNDGEGRPRTLSGHKTVEDNGILRIWHDTSTLYFKILDGHVDIDAPPTHVSAAGILHIKKRDFIKQLFTFRTKGPTIWKRLRAYRQFFMHFAAVIWDVYFTKQKLVADPTRERDITAWTLEGVKDAEITTHHVKTDDKLTLGMFRFKRAPSKDVVVLLHGLSTSTDMFIMPEHYNIVNYLHDHGYSDVWSVDWRGSMRYSMDVFPNTYNIDDVALYDHPAAFKAIREAVGEDARIHVICHCVGSISFMASLFSGLVHVDSVISNSVSLTPQVATWGKIKAIFAPPLMTWLLRFPNLNPNWANLPGPGIPQGKILAKFVSLFHPECDVPACHMLSFMWGTGNPAVYVHDNMLDVTHRRVGDLFGAVALSFDRHLKKCVFRGKVVKYRDDPRYDALPNNYLDYAEKVDTPILFVSGTENRVFKHSNRTTFEALNRLRPDNPFAYKNIDGYGHQDPFMGKAVDEDVFPMFLDFLNRQSVDVTVKASA